MHETLTQHLLIPICDLIPCLLEIGFLLPASSDLSCVHVDSGPLGEIVVMFSIWVNRMSHLTIAKYKCIDVLDHRLRLVDLHLGLSFSFIK